MSNNLVGTPVPSGPAAPTVETWERVIGGKLGRAMAAWTAGQTLYGTAKKVWNYVQAERQYTVKLSADDECYDAVHGAVLDLMPDQRRRSLTVRTVRVRGLVSEWDGSDEPEEPTPLILQYDGARTQNVVIFGQKVTVAVETPDAPSERGGVRPVAKMVFTTHSLAGRDAVLRFIRSHTKVQVSSEPRLMVAGQWSDWHRFTLPTRALDTVILTAGQREALVEDMQRFLDSEQTYVNLGMPWHRGYVFHGPPGTGKTSAAKALAHHFGLDVYYIMPQALKGDVNLTSLMQALPPRAVLLLEDIDALRAAVTREDDGSERVTIAGLLNVLDGVLTPHGLIVMMTTNHLDALDDGLVRPGRADRIEHFDYLNGDQFQRLVKMATGYPVAGGHIRTGVSPAAVLEAMKPHLGYDDEAAARAALDVVRQRREAVA